MGVIGIWPISPSGIIFHRVGLLRLVISSHCKTERCWGWCLQREEIIGLLMMSNGTRSETGQIPGTLDEVAGMGRNPGFQVLISTPFRQWTPSRMGAWFLLQGENHSSPRSSRSLRSDVWLRNGSDSGILSVHFLGDNRLGQRLSFDCSPTLHDLNYLGKVPLKRGDNGASEYGSHLAPTRKRARGRN